MKPDTEKRDVCYNNYITEMSDDSESDSSRNRRSTSRSGSDDSDSPVKYNSQHRKSEERKKSVRSRSTSTERHKSKDKKSKSRRHYGKDDSRQERESKHRYRRSRSPSYRRRSASPQRRHSRHHGSPSRSRRDRSPKRAGSFERRPPGKLSKFEKLGIPVSIPGSGDAQSLPSYYNPVAMNPAKYAEQVAKRKLLWGNTSKTQDTSSTSTESGSNKPKGTLWQGATFSQDRDGKMTAKFQRLMGIKQAEGENSAGTSNESIDKDLIKKQEELFSSMELQYEAARAATHTQRGVGLGFSYHHYPQ